MINRALFILTFVVLSMVSCKKDDDRADDTSIDPSAVTSGSWRVSLFSERGENETSDFNGYAFTFNANGTLTAVKSAATKTGTWSISVSSRKFNIDLGIKSDDNKPLGELTDDWEIISVNTNEIRLKDDNDDSAELLTFSRN